MMLCGMGKYGRVMTQYIGIVYDVIFLLLVLGAAEAGRRRGFASGLVSRMLGRVLRGINAIPLIGGLNRILGFAFGFVSGLLNCWIWSILLWVAANLTGGKLEFLTTATLNRSVIYGLLANLNPFLTRY